METLRSKNIMLITQSLSGGGAEKVAANLSLGLKGEANVTIVTYWEDSIEYEYAGERININLVGNGIVGKILCALKRIHLIKKIKKQKNIDCTISYMPPCDYINVLSRVMNEKIIINVGSNTSTVYQRGISKWFRKFVLHQADYLITVSEGVREDLKKHFGVSDAQSRTIYNSCDIAAIKAAIESDNNQQVTEKKYIVSMGSFRQPKGHWHLIKAYESIKDDVDVDLVILGDGIYRDKYIELIEKFGLQNRVHMPGFINPPFGVVARSEIFVFSSVFEGFGNVVIEAMVCGVPVVSVDCRFGPREILDPDTSLDHVCSSIELCEYGIISPAFPVDDIDTTTTILDEERALGKAILKMLSDNTLREEYINKAKVYCERYNNEHFTSEWISIINEIRG